MKIINYGSGSSGNCYRVIDEASSGSLLLDAGLSCKELIKSGARLSNINGVLVTHSHRDHCKAVREMIIRGMNVYVTKDTALAMSDIHGLNYKQIEFKTFAIGPFLVTPFSLVHDVPNVGYLISTKTDKLVYITDTAYCQFKFSGLTYIMVECNYSIKNLSSLVNSGGLLKSRYDRLLKSHFALERVLKFLAANDLSKVKTIYLLHLSDSHSDEELFKREVERATGIPTIVAARKGVYHGETFEARD